MKLFLTSYPFLKEGGINPENDFLWNIKYSLPYETNALFVASSYKDAMVNDRVASEIKNAFNSAGIFFKTMDILDFRTAGMSKEEICSHDLIVLAGGHVPTQNDFFKAINLKSKLDGYEGTVLGISAGSMNAAEEVYVLPELEGEAIDDSFVRFMPGLGLTKTQIIPHYEDTIDQTIDGFSMLERIRIDNKNRKFLGLPDGSYLMSTDGHELIYGPFYKIENRTFTKVEAGFMAKSFD